jgi:hypothetical protein
MHHADDPTPPRTAEQAMYFERWTQRRNRRQRQTLADEFERAARRGRPVAACETELLSIADVLRSPRPLPLRGLSAVRALLADHSGPLYREDGELPDALLDIERDLGMQDDQEATRA